MKQREPRRKVLIRARMCAGATWHDVCILNISSRGLQLQAAAPPVRGSYMEVRLGYHVIVAQVVWARDHRFGVRTQDPLPIDSIIAEPNSSTAGARPAAPAAQPVERRSAPRRLTGRHDRSRMIARGIDFAGVAILVVAGAALVQAAVAPALGEPLAVVATALGEG